MYLCSASDAKSRPSYNAIIPKMKWALKLYHLYHHQLQIALFYGRLFSFSHTFGVSRKDEEKKKYQQHNTQMCNGIFERSTAYLKKKYIFEYRWSIKRSGTESTNATILHDKRNSNERMNEILNWKKNTFLHLFCVLCL